MVAGIAVAGALVAMSFAAGPPKRARPPVWSRDVLDAFFEDARDALEGERPDYNQSASTAPASTASAGGPIDAASSFAWSKLIDPDTLETEVKRIRQSLDATITTPSAFKGGGYQIGRRDFSELALLFAVIGEHDGRPRWQDAAPGLRDLFARAGHNAKVGTDATYNEAKLRQQDLADLIRGSRPQLSKAERDADLSKIADRTPLMQRLNVAHEDRLTKWLADAASFRRSRSDVRHEAQLVAMIAEAIGREGFDFWDDKEYAAYARDLKQAASDLAAADNFDQARAAIANATNACTECHSDYR